MHCIPKKWSTFIENMSNMCNNPQITLFMNNIEIMIVRSSNSRHIYGNTKQFIQLRKGY